MRRTKTKTYDNVTLTFAALTLGRIRHWSEEGETREVMVMRCLNEALPADAPEADKWTAEKMADSFDPILLKMVADDILTFSGIEIPGEDFPTTPAGKDAAASASKNT